MSISRRNFMRGAAAALAVIPAGAMLPLPAPAPAAGIDIAYGAMTVDKLIAAKRMLYEQPVATFTSWVDGDFKVEAISLEEMYRWSDAP